MLDRDFNDRTTSYLTENLATIGSFRCNLSRAGNFSALYGELAALVLLMATTIGAVLTVQSPQGREHYVVYLGAPREIFTGSFSPRLARDRTGIERQRRGLAYAMERRMGESQLMSRWQPYIAEASRKFGVPRAWIRAVMKMESGGRTMSAENKPITSPVGAVGLMQLMPATYSEMRKQHRLGADPSDPHDNIMAGTAYLHWLHRKYGFPAMFVAYNEGPGSLEAGQANGRALPVETQNYVARITMMLGASGTTSAMRVGQANPGVRGTIETAPGAVRIHAQYS